MAVLMPELVEMGRLIGETLRHRGILDCDVYFDGQHVYLVELNPRFGGGYPFSAEAGAKVPSALIAWARGEEPEGSWATMRTAATYGKCDRLVCVDRHCGSSVIPALMDEAPLMAHG